MSARDKLYGLISRLAMTDSADWHDDVQKRIDAYRDEALAEADLLPKADVVAWLTKKAREDTPVWELASKVDRGAVRPDNLRMLPADFFEPGHAYTHRDGSDFRCVAVTAHPNTGERRALGWIVRNGWHEGGALDPDDWQMYDGCQPPAEDGAS